jgi:hypothetical protein
MLGVVVLLVQTTQVFGHAAGPRIIRPTVEQTDSRLPPR